MRSSKKNELSNHIAEQYTIHDVIPDSSSKSWKKVVNSGMLLHKLPWQIGNTFSSVLDSYVKHVDGMGKGIHIIFDGYLSSNTKDHCHRKRNPIQSNAIELTSSMLLDSRKDLFLSNNGNKQMLDLLAIRLISAGHNVFQYTDDADTIIVDRAIELAEEFNVYVHASDTDTFTLLINKLKLSTPNTVCLIQKKSNRAINMTTLIQVISEAKRKTILLFRAMSGCDTTSIFFGIGKTKLFKSPILKQSPNDAFLFTDNDCPIKDITDAGEQIILKLYGNHKSKTLGELRVLTCRKKLLSKLAKNKIDPCNLPPSSNGAKYHTLKVYHTVQE